MNEATVLEIARGAVQVTLLTSGPLLLVGTAVGLVVALIQALTTVQEQTLSFAPRIIAVGAVLIVSLPWTIRVVSSFTLRMLEMVAGAAT